MTDFEWKTMMEKSPQLGCEVLIEQYGDLVYAIVCSKLKSVANSEDIEDCMSEIFIEIFQNHDRYSPSSGTLKAYLSTIAKRKAINAYKKITYRKGKSFSIDEEDIILKSSENNPEEEAENKQTSLKVWEIIQNLGEPDSTIIIRQYFYEQTTREIASALSMTAAAVQKRSIRARKKLKEIMEKELNMKGIGDYYEKIQFQL